MKNDKRSPIVTVNNGFDPRNVNFVEESLFPCANGYYRLHGKGGSFSKYANRRDDGSMVAGERDLYLSEDEMVEWLSTHFSVEDAVSIICNM